jgi:hypothetical protein
MDPSQQVNGPIEELIEATRHKKHLERALDEVKKTIEQMKAVVLEKFLAEGTKSVRRDDGTISIRKQFSVKPKNSKEHVVEALIASGYDDMVNRNYNYMSLCSFIREMDDRQEEIPEELLEALDITEDQTIMVRTTKE